MKPAHFNTAAMFVDVVIALRDPDAPPYETRRINYHNDKSRGWLEKAQWWALHNGYTVHMAPVTNEDN